VIKESRTPFVDMQRYLKTEDSVQPLLQPGNTSVSLIREALRTVSPHP